MKKKIASADVAYHCLNARSLHAWWGLRSVNVANVFLCASSLNVCWGLTGWAASRGSRFGGTSTGLTGCPSSALFGRWRLFCLLLVMDRDHPRALQALLIFIQAFWSLTRSRIQVLCRRYPLEKTTILHLAVPGHVVDEIGVEWVWRGGQMAEEESE